MTKQEKLIEVRDISYDVEDLYINKNPNKMLITWAPTLACNYRCSYCEFTHQGHNLSIDKKVIEATVAFCKKILSTKEHPSFTLFGGEPTIIPKDTFDYIVDEILKIPNIEFILYTNLTASSEFYKELQDKGVELEVSYHKEEAAKHKHDFFKKFEQLNTELTDTHIMYEEDSSIDDVLRAREIAPKTDPAFIRPAGTWDKIYTKEQMDVANKMLENSHTDVKSLLYIYKDEAGKTREELHSYSSAVGHDLNRFHRWVCQARAMNLFIDPLGNVYNCQVYWGARCAPMFNIMKDKIPSTFQPTICKLETCECELFLPKKKVFNG